jgi:uncharacterized protein (DUF342 family)
MTERFKTIYPLPERIDGDVSADLASDRALAVSGSLLNVTISAVALSVTGDVRGAQVNVRGAVEVDGEFCGDGRSRCVAGGGITSDAARRYALICGGSVSIRRELCDARTCASGSLVVAGSIRGGHTAANAGIECGVAGSPDGVRTVISAGVDLYFHASATRQRQRIESDLARAQQAKADYQSALVRLKSLTPKEREAMTVSLYEAEELQRNANAAFRSLQVQYRSKLEQARPEIAVRERVHAGVTLRLGNWVAKVSEGVSGSYRISAEHRDGRPAVVFRDTGGGPEIVFPAAAMQDDIALNDAMLRSDARTAPLAMAA